MQQDAWLDVQSLRELVALGARLKAWHQQRDAARNLEPFPGGCSRDATSEGVGKSLWDKVAGERRLDILLDVQSAGLL